MNNRDKYFSSARWPGLLLALLVAAVLFSACATVKEKRYEKGGIILIYKPKAELGSEMEKVTLAHPIRLSEEEIRNHLLSLRYEELSLLGKGKYVYSPQDVLKFSGLVTKAVNRLRPDHFLYFEWETPHGSTVAEVFASGGQIHWRFDKINGMEFSSNSFPGWRGSSWRLVPKEGQAYHIADTLLGKNSRENWIVSDLTLPSRSTRKVKEKPPSRSPEVQDTKPDKGKTNSRELEEKLEVLKQWREKNLIDEKEYQLKRKELLDTFL